ncbi:MAG: hypothetical protein Q9199_004401 [Rusavskia elegans]
MTGLSKHILLLLAMTAIVQGQKGAPAGYCKADTDCFCTICPGGKSATCQAAGMGQGSGATSQVARASSAASTLTANPNPNTANVAKTAIDDALAAAEHLKDLVEDAAIIALLTQLIGPLKAAQAAAIAAVATPSAETAAAVAVALSAAAAAEAALEASAAGGPSTCSLEKRSTGHERRMLGARQSGFCFKWDGSVPNPVNLAEIPAIQNCVGTSGSNSYTQAAVNTALKEGLRYLFGQQVAGSNKYPHTYKNLDAGVHTDPACAGLDIQEFPILSDGSPVARGPGAKSTALFPGSERVLFALGNGVVFYCGLITHVGPQAGGPPPGNLVPFRNCTP